MTHLNCPLHQPRCGLQEGNSRCPKCGLDVLVPYVSKEDGEAARKTAQAAWAVADRAEAAQSESPPTPPPPKPEGESEQSQEPKPKPPLPPVPEPPKPPGGGARLLIVAALSVLLAGGGYLYWQQQKVLQAALEQQQLIQQTQEREKAQGKQIALAQEQQVRQAREQALAAEQSKQAAQAALEKQLSMEREKEQAQARVKADRAPPTSPKTCRDCPEMMVVPSGNFQMGSNDSEANDDEKPVHNVSVKTFAIGKYEVTQGQWKAIMGSNPSHFANCGDNCPVEQVSWDDIQIYIQKLNKKLGIAVNDPTRYRLPSEAEWEWACRGGQRHKYCGSDTVESVAWYKKSSAYTTHPVGHKAPNGFGLYDMSGNVLEWVQDWYHDSYHRAPSNGGVWESGGEQKTRVRRGGFFGGSNATFASRYDSSPAIPDWYSGFRLARTLP